MQTVSGTSIIAVSETVHLMGDFIEIYEIGAFRFKNRCFASSDNVSQRSSIRGSCS